MFIYKITNKINGKIYIGQTIKSIYTRWLSHISRSKNKITAIGAAIDKHGKENFIVEEIDGANSLSELNYKEEFWIYKLNSVYPFGYNLNYGGKNRKHSEESKRKIGLANSKRAWKESSKQKISKANSGRIRILNNPELTSKILSINCKKQWKSKEIRNKMIEGIKKSLGTREYRENASKIKKAMWSNKEWAKIFIKKNTESHNTEEYKAKASKLGKAMWSNKEWANKFTSNSRDRIGRKLLCFNNNKIYRCSSEASSDLQLKNSNYIRKIANNIDYSYKGYKFIFLDLLIDLETT